MKKENYQNYFWQNHLVRLRAMKEEDWESHYYNRFDTPARRLLNYEVELPPTVEEAQSMTKHFQNFNQESGRIMFTIETLDGINLGGGNINSIDEKNGTFSIGIQIDRDHRNRGYGSAAFEILLRYAFFERRLNKYYGSVLEGNIASATMLMKLGCHEEGRRVEMVYTNGKYYDEILYGLTKTAFQVLQSV